jgi:diguanylate cyclase (GGDEF)-like protein/PAS domain S-box-containing protein
MKVDRAFKKLADSLPLMMAYVDNQGRYQHVNQAYRNFIGLELHQVKGKFISEIIGAESYQQITLYHQRVLAGEEVSFTDKVTFVDGRSFQLDVKYVPNIENKTGRVNGFFAIINDVTEYASAAEVLRAVHDVVNRQTQTLSTDRINELLRLGCHYLNTQYGIVSQVEDTLYTVKFSYADHDPVPPGSRFDLGDTYCSITLEAENVVATTHASKSKPYAGHPCYQQFQLQTYLGLPITINGTVWGTVNFSSPQVRSHPFSELDIELMGLICSAIETILINSSKTKRLEKLAYTDFLTGLSNRLYLTERFNELTLQRHTNSKSCCFALIDIDHFKAINDTFGHDIGDKMLQQTALKIAGLIRTTDTLTRIGGEEFALIITGLNQAQADSVLEKIRRGVENNKFQLADGSSLAVTVSIGATLISDAEPFKSAYKQADLALYKSKRGGRNRTTWSQQSLTMAQ